MKSLVILTSRFPYPPGEEFLRNEVDELARFFHSIKILPTNSEVFFSGAVKKEVPANVEVIQPLKVGQGKIMRTLKLFADFQAVSWLFQELPQASKHGLKAILKLINWTAISSELKQELEKSGTLSKDGEEIYYSYWLTPSATALAMLKEKNPSLNAVSRVHGGDLYLERHLPPYLPYQGKVIKTLNQTFSISENGREYLSNLHPSASENVSVHRLGTKNEAFLEPRTKSNSLRLLSCSYLKPVKRMHLLAEALRAVKAPVVWTHIGDGSERGKIEGLMKELPEHIEVKLIGNLSNEEVIDYYRRNSADWFINVSESEGIPVTIMEAFSFGVPVIATDVGGTSELVNKDNGYLLPKNFSIKELSLLLDTVFHLTEEEYQQKSNQAFDTWNNQYNAIKNYKNFAATLKGVSNHEDSR